MTGSQIIVLATPIFLLAIAVEFAVGRLRGRNTYRAADAMSSIGLGMISQGVGVFTKAFTVGVYTAAYEHVALTRLDAQAWWVWIGALLVYDFFYYWHHRFGHRIALFWAAHVVHHQSEDYNLSTALRQTGSGWLLGWIVYLPMAVAGVPPVVFATVALIDLLYQFWVHTQQVGKLGWFDRWFCSPSNHRVHHAVNDIYLDKNYGGILVIWDRLFGTFQEELDAQPCIYGTRRPLRSWNPLWANLEVYVALARDASRACSWVDKLRVLCMPPGWRPADVARADPQPAFDIGSVRLHDPPVGPRNVAVAMAIFVLAMGATTVLLWFAHTLAVATAAALAMLVMAMLWAVGWLTEGVEPAHAGR
jgi:sterol desaturase/sphingolipid hydroxylase (fatty acid hydroxylase superfamily)